MYKKEIDSLHQEIEDLIFQHKLASAFKKLEVFIKESMSFELKQDFEQVHENYSYLLQFLMKGYQDTERQNVYDSICRNLTELNDKARQNALFYCPELPHFKGKNYYTNQGKLTIETAEVLLDKIISSRAVSDMLLQTKIEDDDQSLDEQSKQGIEELFRIFWLTDYYDEAEIFLFEKLVESEEIKWYEKCLIVSAVTLGLLNNFDVNKFVILIDSYLRKLPNISERAFTGLFLSVCKYDRRLKYYPNLKLRFLTLIDHDEFIIDIKSLIYQLIITKDTEEISKKLQEEILPEMIKYAPEIREKLDIEKLLSDKDEDEKNPKWKELFKDIPGLYDKMEELSKLQMQGSDMFMSTFSHLKHFPFFNNLTNWLLPFHAEEKSLQNIFLGETETIQAKDFLSAMESAPYICNSDKYSFCFNLKALPDQQKHILLDMFIEESHSLSEMVNEEGKLYQGLKSKIIITQYLQDLYRFFKLNPSKNHFEDIFQMELNLCNTNIFRMLVPETGALREIAEYYFEKKHFPEAQEIFLSLIEFDADNVEILQKLGFCYQHQKNYSKAINYYLKADIIDSGNVWTWRKLAYCYLKSEDYENALKYYQEIEKEDPENWKVQAYIAHCLYAMKNYEQALNIFYKVDLLNPDNPQILKTIAFLNFRLKKYEEALSTYLKLSADQLNYIDFLNIGHLYWSMSQRQNAVEYYLKSIIANPEGTDGFMKQLLADRDFLIEHGIPHDEIPLMLDYLLIYREGKIKEF